MPRINVETDYFDHPKTHRLKVYCGEEADIFPIRLWSFCAKYFAKDGLLAGYSETEIERICGWKGVSGNLIRALEQVGFLVKHDVNMYAINDWQDHAGFIWNYKIAGKKGGKKSGLSRRLKAKTNRSDLERIVKRPRTIELNGIELNKDVSGSLETASVPPPPKPLTDLQKVVICYKVASGYPKDDAAWDKLNFARCSKSAKALLEFLGSWSAAGDCIQDVYEKLHGKGLTVTLETVTKHAADWQKDRNERLAGRGL